MEEELFKVENNVDNECYTRLQTFYLFVLQKNSLIALIIFYVLSLIFCIYNTFILKEKVQTYLIIEVIFTVFILLVFLYPKLRLWINKTANTSEKIKNDRLQIFTFTDKGIKIQSNNLEAQYQYATIYKVYETKEDLFLSVNKNSMFIIPKTNITNLDELNKLLENKLGKKFNRRHLKD